MTGGCAALMLLGAWHPGWSATETGLDGILGRIGQAEDALHDVSLKFSQTTVLRATADVQTTTGDLAVLKKPERFRVRFLAPVRQIAVFDGAALTLYYPESEQAFRQRATAEQLALMLGVNPAEPVRSFRRGYAARLEGCGKGQCRLAFSRGQPAELTWHVTVSSSTWLMSDAWFENPEVRVTLKCYDYVVNAKMSPKDFRLKLPASVDVQEGLPQMGGGIRP